MQARRAATSKLFCSCWQAVRLQTSAPEEVRLLWTSSYLQRFLPEAQEILRPRNDTTKEVAWTVSCCLQWLGEETMNRSQRIRQQLQQVRQDFARHPGDVGSSEVQVAALTTQITAMAEHMRTHRKDYASRRGLEAMLTRRRKLLQYLRRTDFESYAITLSRLGLRDNYVKLNRAFGVGRPAKRGNLSGGQS